MHARKPWISPEQIYLISGDIAQINPTELQYVLVHTVRQEIPLLFLFSYLPLLTR